MLEHFPEILRDGHLQAADRAMGRGPFRVYFASGVEFWVEGTGVVTGIREMFVRDGYLRGGVLDLQDGDHVLDLGANIGNFTKLALAHGKSVTVTAVEPSRTLNEDWTRSLALNPGFTQRARLVRAFVGLIGKVQEEALRIPAYADARILSEEQLLAETGIQRIDFLKCDIEGGEFGLLTPQSKILALAQKIAIELHPFAGDVEGFISMLAKQGFHIRHVERSPGGTAVVLAAREGAT